MTIFPTYHNYYDYPHFTDKGTVTARLNNLPKITQLVSDGEKINPGNLVPESVVRVIVLKFGEC